MCYFFCYHQGPIGSEMNHFMKKISLIFTNPAFLWNMSSRDLKAKLGTEVWGSQSIKQCLADSRSSQWINDRALQPSISQETTTGLTSTGSVSCAVEASASSKPAVAAAAASKIALVAFEVNFIRLCYLKCLGNTEPEICSFHYNHYHWEMAKPATYKWVSKQELINLKCSTISEYPRKVDKNELIQCRLVDTWQSQAFKESFFTAGGRW